MKWEHKLHESKIDRLERWHKWFAWHPISIEHADGSESKIWFETVDRKGTQHGGYDVDWWDWRYKER